MHDLRGIKAGRETAEKDGEGAVKEYLKTNTKVMERKQITLWETCVHEAGHAAACLLLGVPVLDVRVGYGLDGWCQHEYVEDVIVEALITVAGAESERLFGFSGLLTSGGDAKILKKLHVTKDGKAFLEKNIRLILTPYKERVQALAEALRVGGSLRDQEVDRIFWDKVRNPRTLFGALAAIPAPD